MKLLILTAFYPVPGGSHERMFVHVRDKYYVSQGIDVTVLNFASDHDYEIDGVKVITLRSYEKQDVRYDIAVSHAPNLRNHYRFLKKYENRFPHLVFFFHGFEMMYLTKDYPKPYKYDKTRKWYMIAAQHCYDRFKIALWGSYYKVLAHKSDYVFVSNWMLDCFKRNTGLTERDLNGRCHIINNSVGEIFEKENYDWEAEKRYDFITIRPNLDNAKYCIDLVVGFAEKHPEKKMLLIGKGHFFEHNKLPENIEWIANTLSHNEMLGYINSSKCALMPTRTDAQGVMTCEFVTYGIPVVTSDIDVCHEFFDGVPNVRMVLNGTRDIDPSGVEKGLEEGLPYSKYERCFAKNTIQKEVDLYESISKLG